MSEIVPATLEHFVALYGHPPQFSFQGFTVLGGDKPVGIGGLYYSNGAHVVFSRITEPIRKRDIVRVSHKVMALARDKRVPVYAHRDQDVATSPSLLAHFGFEQMTSEVYLWRG